MKKKRENGRLGSAILRSFMLVSVVPMPAGFADLHFRGHGIV